MRLERRTRQRLIPWIWAISSVLAVAAVLLLGAAGPDEPRGMIVVGGLGLAVGCLVALGPVLTLRQSRLLDRLRSSHRDAIVFAVQSSPRFGTTAAAIIGPTAFRTPLLGVAVVDAQGLTVWAAGLRARQVAHCSWAAVSRVEPTDALYLLWGSARCVQFHVRIGDVVVPLALAPLADDWRLFLSVPVDPSPLVDRILSRFTPAASGEGIARRSEFPGDDAAFLAGAS